MSGGIAGSNFIEPVGNGWYRVGFSGVVVLTGDMVLYTPIKDLTEYTGDVSQYTEYWGLQIEESISPSGYLKTDGEAASVTLIENPSNKSYDILGNALRLRQNAFNLDGSGYAEVDDNDSLDMSEGFSVSFWTKLNPEASGIHQTIVAKGSGLGTHVDLGMAISLYADKVYFDLNTSVQRYSLNTPAQTMDGSWLFVTATYTKLEKTRLYLNTTSPLVYSGDISGTINEDHNITIGSNVSGGHRLLSQVDEVIWYDRPLSQKEITNNYNIGLADHS